MIVYNNKTYDFDGILPVVDGVRLRSKTQIKDAILDLLHSVGYRFDGTHNMPCLLVNYRDSRGSDLIYLLKCLVKQVSSASCDFPWYDYDIEFFGFAKNNKRLCIIKFTYGGLFTEYPISIDLVSFEVNKLLSKVSQGSKFSIEVS